jgi:protocatechuate 3,4-dioxygenase beta subunit
MWLALCVSCVLAGGTAAASPQVRDATPRSQQPVGTAVLAGQVVTDDSSSRPVRRARVTVMAGQLSVPRSTVTDDEGRFVFTGLAAGSLSLSVSKPGFVSSYYGSKTPGRPPGVPIALLEGQRLTNVSVRLLPGSVITGRVTRERGQPAVGVSVQAAFVQMVNGQRRQSFIASAQALSAQTDDRGEYRLYGLAPGEYLITARAGLGFGTAGDARQMTAAELRWAEQTTGRGGAAGPAASVPPAPGQTMIYSTVYFPGTADASAAATVTIGPGEERSGVSFTTPLVPTARITGTIVDPSGAPIPGAQVQLRSKRAAEGLSDIIDSLLTTSATSAADGSFTLSSITPGEYRLSVRAAEPRPGAAGQRVAAAAGVAPAGLFGGAGQASLWAAEDVFVQGRDIANLALRLQPGMTVSGKVVYESTTKPAPTDFSRTSLMLSSPGSGGGMAGMVAAMLAPSILTIAADGTFTAKGVVPGSYRVTVFGAGMILNQQLPGSGDGWTLKSALLAGRDVSDVPFEVRPGENVSNLVVTFTDRPTELSGVVYDQANRPIGSFPIVVFSSDRAFWTSGSRRVQLIRPSSDGKFKTTGLPPGEYFVCAATEVDDEQLYELSFLELLVPGSFKITLAEGEKRTLDLKLGGG